MVSFFASAVLTGLLAQSSPNESAAGPPDSNDLSKQFDSILTAPTPPSQSRKTQGPAGSGLMNPDISVIFDGVAGAANRPRASSAGDDPDFGGPAGTHTGGFAVQEVEVGLQSTVDPYFAANVFLTIPNLQGIEVEEAYAVTTALPAGLQVKAGVFRSAAGRQNEQHLHMQDFSLRPLVNQAYLGTDGLRPPGAQVSWLLPLPFFLRLTGEALSVATGASPTFGGGLRSSPTFLGNVKTFAALGESWSLFVGGTVVTGHAPPAPPAVIAENSTLESNGPRTLLAGGDVYLKYMPPNHVASYFALSVQSEYFWRHTASEGAAPAQSDAGFYTQIVAQLARRWHLGARFDQLGLPASDLQPKGDRLTGMVMVTPSEFSRLRLQGQREKVDRGGAIYEALLLLEFSIGAHGAHPF
jgi:hypothetical protein